MYYRLSAASFAVLVCLSTLVGCGESGPPLGKVTGTVTMDGKPLSNAIVSFVPIDGSRSSSAMTDDTGNYRLSFVSEEGALIGQHTVSITSVAKAEGNTMEDIPSDDPRYAEMMQSRQSDYNSAKVKESIPAVYNKKSELVREVKSGNNKIDFPLTSDGKLP